MIAKITVDFPENQELPPKVDCVVVMDKRNGSPLMRLDVRSQRHKSIARPYALEITAGIRGIWHFLNQEEVNNAFVYLWAEGRKIFPTHTTIEDVYGNWKAVFSGVNG